MNTYKIAADLLLYVHFGFVLFVVGGFVLIWMGYFLKWPWIRNRVFRILHLLAMGTVTAQALGAIPCPLTVWERNLRQATGKETYQGSFMNYWVDRLLFYEWSELTFVLIYVAFFVLIVASLLVVKPRWGGGRPPGGRALR